MKVASDQLRRALPGPIDITYEADILRGSERLEEAVPLASLDLTWDATASVEATGTCRIVRSPLLGESWVPERPGDMLAPFGTELAVTARCRLGAALDVRVPMGVYPIMEVGDTATSRAVIRGTSYVVAESIELNLADRMAGVVEDRFTRPETPTTAPTAYAELERLTGRTVVRTRSDINIRSGILYDKERDEAVQQIAGLLGGDAYFNPVGELQVRPDRAGARVVTLRTEHISPVASKLSAQGVFNGIVVTGKAENGSELRTERFLPAGHPLSPASWGRRVPKFFHSDYLYTAQMVAAEAERQLAEIAAPIAQYVEAQVLPHPLLELGDVVGLRQPSGAVLEMRLTSIRVGAGMWTIGGGRL